MGAQLVKNPSFELTLAANVRRVDRPRDVFRLASPRGQEYARVLVEAASWDGRAPMPPALRRNAAFLEEIGVLVRPEERPKPVEADLPLDRSMLSWISARARRDVAAKIAREPLALNPRLLLQTKTKRPESARLELPPSTDFPFGRGLLWVKDPENGTWAGHRPSAEVLDVVRGLLRGRRTAGDLADEMRELLIHARILVPRDVLARGAEGWKNEVARARRSLRKDSYAVLRPFVSPLQVAQLRSYFHARAHEGYFDIDKTRAREVRLRTYAKDDLIATYMHRQTTALVRDVTGDACVPSFNYVSRYKSGAKLKRHTDRDQCRWNVSCLFESNHGQDLQRSSPIFLESGGRVHEIRLDYGEAVLYEGWRIPHWRNPMRPGEEQTLLLLFWVLAGFAGSLR